MPKTPKVPHQLRLALAAHAVISLVTLSFVLWLVIGYPDKQQSQANLTAAINRVVKQADPATVTIINNFNGSFSFMWPQEAFHRLGAGFVASADGLILTNRQAVPDPVLEYTVVFANGKSYPAHAIYRDPVYDLVLLQIDATDLPILKLAADAMPAPGEPVVALGNRWQAGETYLSTGRITAVNRQGSVTHEEATIGADNQRTYVTVNKIFHGVLLADAEFNFGNAGGPLLNDRGEVAGVIFTSDSELNQGFAIPATDVRFVLENFQKNGKVIQADLGVTNYLLGARLEPYDQGFVYGAMISTLCENAPAAAVGFRLHDRITTIDGIAIGLDLPLERALRPYQPGDQVLVDYLTAVGEAKSTVVTLFDREAANGKADVSCIP